MRDRNRGFEGLAGFTVTAAGLGTGENPSLTWAFGVSGNYFDVLVIDIVLRYAYCIPIFRTIRAWPAGQFC